MDKNGENVLLLKKSSKCRISGYWNNTLYFYDIDTQYAYEITEKDGEIKEICSTPNDVYFVNSYNCYYTHLGLFYTNLDNGATTKLIEDSAESYSLDPEFELINTTDTTKIICKYCDEILVCHNTLYVRVTTKTLITVYNFLTKKVDNDESFTYRWYAVDMATNTVTQTSVDTESICVFDNAILSENGEKFTVIQ